MDWIDALFSGSGFMPHGFCYTWDPRVIWLNAASDTGIALAYYAIPVLLVYLVRQRKDLAFHYIFLLFALFILACGTTHMLEVISIWHPVYWLAGVTKAATAAVSILTTMALVPLVPKILALPSPEALQQANRELQGAQGALQEINATLEARIAERVASLAEANAALRNEIDERKRTDDRLRASEAQFRLAISSSPIPSMIWDAAGAVRLVSQGWTDCSGYALEDLPTLSDWMQKAYGEEKEAADLYIAAHFAGTETTHDGERAIQAKDGGERTWDFYTTPLGPDQAGFRLFISRAFDITDRRRAEAAQAQLAAIVTGSDDAILSKSMDGTLTTWNEGAERMFGYTAGEMIGQPVARLLPPDRLDEEKQILARLERGEHVGHYETVRQGKDGRLIEVSLSISPLQDGHGQVIGASKIARDITARKRTERALQESEARFRTMANSIPQLAWMTRPDGYIVWYNRRWFDYTGTTPEEMEGWGWQRVHDPDVLPAVMKQWQGAIAAGVPWEMEFPLRAADGRYRMFLTRVTPLKDVEGRILQWFGTNTDISDRLEAEQELQESRARYEGIIYTAMDAIVSVDEAEWVVVFNGAAERMFGCTVADALGQPLGRFIPLLVRPLDVRVLAANGETEQARDLKGRRANGEEFPLEASISQSTAGGRKRITVIAREITDRLRGEQLELENVRLESRSRQVEEANRLKSEFLANMSHELRTPLNGIIGFSEFLVDERPGPLNPQQKEFANDVLQSARHLLHVISDILDLAKVEAGKMEFRFETFSAAQAIEEACAVVQGTAHKKGVSLTWTVAPELGLVTLDQGKFKQVGYNLLSNALKFTERGGTVEVKVSPCSGDLFELRVRDTGIGIKEEDLPRLFQQFEQLDSGSGRRFEGTGLGLALTKKIVELQGGTIGVESEFARGSTFSVVLPRQAKPHVREYYIRP